MSLLTVTFQRIPDHWEGICLTLQTACKGELTLVIATLRIVSNTECFFPLYRLPFQT